MPPEAPEPVDLSPLVEWLDNQPEITAAWLFGSGARGEAHGRSDVDVAVLLGDKPTAGESTLRHRLAWTSAMAGTLGLSVDRLDLLILDEARPLLVHAVLKEGKLLIDKAPSARVRFEEEAFHRYVIAARLRDQA